MTFLTVTPKDWEEATIKGMAKWLNKSQAQPSPKITYKQEFTPTLAPQVPHNWNNTKYSVLTTQPNKFLQKHSNSQINMNAHFTGSQAPPSTPGSILNKSHYQGVPATQPNNHYQMPSNSQIHMNAHFTGSQAPPSTPGSIWNQYNYQGSHMPVGTQDIHCQNLPLYRDPGTTPAHRIISPSVSNNSLMYQDPHTTPSQRRMSMSMSNTHSETMSHSHFISNTPTLQYSPPGPTKRRKSISESVSLSNATSINSHSLYNSLPGPMSSYVDPRLSVVSSSNNFSVQFVSGEEHKNEKKNARNVIDTKIFGPPPYPPSRREEYIWDLPVHIQPWLEEVFDVDGDGHCGFRAVSFCLERGQGDYMRIRSELYDELKNRKDFYRKATPFYTVEEHMEMLNVPSSEPCGIKYWMGMPGMGRIIANTYQRPVFFYSEHECSSFFPEFVGPNDNRPITFAFIGSKRHFVALAFKGMNHFPAPKPVGMVQESFSEENLAWRVKYQHFFDREEISRSDKKTIEKMVCYKKEYESLKAKRDYLK